MIWFFVLEKPIREKCILLSIKLFLQRFRQRSTAFMNALRALMIVALSGYWVWNVWRLSCIIRSVGMLWSPDWTLRGRTDTWGRCWNTCWMISTFATVTSALGWSTFQAQILLTFRWFFFRNRTFIISIFDL